MLGEYFVIWSFRIGLLLVIKFILKMWNECYIMIFGFEEDFVCRFLVLVVWIFIIYNIIWVRIVG